MVLQAELLTEVSIQHAAKLIENSNFGAQEKHNGKRRVVIRNGGDVYCFNREGEKRNLPAKLVAAILRLSHDQFVLDGELCGTVISPKFYIFDILMLEGTAFAHHPYSFREKTYTREFTNLSPLLIPVVTKWSKKDKLTLVEELYNTQAEGVVFKNKKATYKQGRSEQHFKLKFWKNCDCVVIGPSPDGHDSVEIGVYDRNHLHRVSGVSLIGRTSVKAGDVVEVKYLYATGDRHIVQPVMVGKRDDKKAKDCTIDQLVVNRDMI